MLQKSYVAAIPNSPRVALSGEDRALGPSVAPATRRTFGLLASPAARGDAQIIVSLLQARGAWALSSPPEQTFLRRSLHHAPLLRIVTIATITLNVRKRLLVHALVARAAIGELRQRAGIFWLLTSFLQQHARRIVRIRACA